MVISEPQSVRPLIGFVLIRPFQNLSGHPTNQTPPHSLTNFQPASHIFSIILSLELNNKFFSFIPNSLHYPPPASRATANSSLRIVDGGLPLESSSRVSRTSRPQGKRRIRIRIPVDFLLPCLVWHSPAVYSWTSFASYTPPSP